MYLKVLGKSSFNMLFPVEKTEIKGKDDISRVYSCFIYFCHCEEMSQILDKDKVAIMRRTCNLLIRSK